MFAIAILIGIYSYIIFILGLLGILYKSYILILSLAWLVFVLVWIARAKREKLPKLGRISLLFLIIIVFEILVNLIGTLGPELAFDALWYHLTLPKLYLESHSIYFVPGGLLYYSAMPKLVEMLYIPALALGVEIVAKLVHFSFGVFSALAIYLFAKRYMPALFAILAALIFYGNLVVAWESTTAYVDLARTFFEITALWGFLLWAETKKSQWLIESAVILGLAVASKVLAVGSIFIFTVLIIYIHLNKKEAPKILTITKDILVSWCASLLVVAPWLVFAFVNIGNPVYPFFSNIYPVGIKIDLLNPIRFVSQTFELFTSAADPISPLYITFLPVIFFLYKKMGNEMRILFWYSILSLIVWYVTPRTGGGRFILPYLPAFSILVAFAIFQMRKKRNFLTASIILVIVTSFITIGYRGIANAKFLPVLFGHQSKQTFISRNLNFKFGDFYDVDGYFAKTITKNDRVLLYGFHNLYYVDFPFIDSSWVQKGDRFNFIAIQDDVLPKRFSYWKLIYYNPATNVTLYTLDKTEWIY